MNTAEVVTAEVVGPIFVLGAVCAAIVREALNKGSVRLSAGFGVVPPGKRWGAPLGEPEISTGPTAERAPAGPVAPAVAIGDGRKVS